MDKKVVFWDVATGKPRESAQLRFAVLTASWSADGKWLACAGHDTSIQLWEIGTTTLHRLEGHSQAPIYVLAWSPDSMTLASGGQDGAVRFWKPPQTQVGLSLKVALPVSALAWSPAGDGVVTATINGVQYWDAGSGLAKDNLSGPNGTLFSLAWSASGIAAGGTPGVLTWRDRNLGAELLESQPAGTAAVAWSPDGRQLAVAGFSDYYLRLWDADTFGVQAPPKGNGLPDKVAAWSPDGRFLATADKRGQVLLWEGQRSLWHTLSAGHTAELLALAWSADGRFLASASADGTVKAWEMEKRHVFQVLKGQPGGVYSLAWSPDNPVLACGALKTIHVVPAMGRAPPPWSAHGSFVMALAWSPDGTVLASGSAFDGGVNLRDPTGKVLLGFKAHDRDVRALEWSSAGRTLASGGDDGRVRFWSPEGKPLGALEGHAGPVRSLSWLNDSDHIASASEDGTVRVGASKAGRHDAVLVPLRGGQGLTVGADGHAVFLPEQAEALVYVLRTAQGLDLCTPDEFSRKWRKNEPKRVHVK
jgi:WD40 repeat protein